jgi:diguanylate cyclase (GGDEF)-like protein
MDSLQEWFFKHKSIKGGEAFFVIEHAKNARFMFSYAALATLIFSYLEMGRYPLDVIASWALPLFVVQTACIYFSTSLIRKSSQLNYLAFFISETLSITMWLGYLYIFGWNGSTELELVWRGFIVFVVVLFALNGLQYSMIFLVSLSSLACGGILIYIIFFSGLPDANQTRYLVIVSLGWLLLIQFGRHGYLLKCENYQVVAKNKELMFKMDDMLIHDELTKVHNRRHFNKELSRYFELYQRYKQSFSLAILDIDFFKQINDTYGHNAGDKVLFELSQYINLNLRSTDVCARYGGEEFALILPKQNQDVAEEVMDKLRQNIAKFDFEYEGEPLSLTVSIGVTTVTEEDTEDTLIRKADQALYRAKASGRNRVELGELATG